MPKSEAYLMDCMEYMRSLPDKAFDLAVCDPPYGGGVQTNGNTEKEAASEGCLTSTISVNHADVMSNSGGAEEGLKSTPICVSRTGGTWATKYQAKAEAIFDNGKKVHRQNNGGGNWKDYTGGNDIRHWDIAPPPEYFTELARVSKNQIIWGGNYFALPPTRCFLVWRKLSISESFSMAMCEYAWTSFNDNAKLFECTPQGTQGEPRFHPCLPVGTKVLFNGEWKPIEKVRVGDTNDFGSVENITTHIAEKMVEINAEGETVTATYNHPFLIRRGNEVAWVIAEQIRAGDKILCLKKNMHLHAKGICDTEQTASASAWNIALCGKNILAKSRTVCKYIIKTLTKQTTRFPICNLSRPLNTSGYTPVATLKTVFGISRVNRAGSLRHLRRIIGTLTKKRDLSLPPYASRVTFGKELKNAAFAFKTVGSVKIIREKTKVYNLSICGIPAFETKIGITHNTQKPVKLYEWIFARYAKQGDRILDTHLGSGSSRIAAYAAGLDFVGTEIDEYYFKKQEERFEAFSAQMSLF